MSWKPKLQYLSVVPLLLELFKDTQQIGVGTGFCVEEGGRTFLITCRHVLTGRHNDTNVPLAPGKADPDRLKVWFLAVSPQGLAVWCPEILVIRDDETDSPRWIEHPDGTSIDVVALELPHLEGRKVFALRTNDSREDMEICPSEAVSIIGFLFPERETFPTWKTGAVASELAVDHGGHSVFLIDATTRPGMSGAPVLAVRYGSYRSAAYLMNGTPAQNFRFLGVYAGRMDEKCEIGRVWKPRVVKELIDKCLLRGPE